LRYMELITPLSQAQPISLRPPLSIVKLNEVGSSAPLFSLLIIRYKK